MRSSSAGAGSADFAVDESDGVVLEGGEVWEKMASSSLLSVGWTRSWLIRVERYWEDLYAVRTDGVVKV